MLSRNILNSTSTEALCAIRKWRGLLLAGLWICSLCRAGIQEAEVYPEVRLRVQSFARTTTPVVNPIRNVQFRSRTPEGTRVEEGDPIFEPNLDPTQDSLKEIQNRLEKVRNEASRQRKELDREMRDLENRLAGLLDSKAIQEAKLAYLQSLPLEENVRIAKGRLAVAETRLAAEQDKLDTMRQRHGRGMISTAQVDQAEHAYALQEARTTFARDSLRSAELPANANEIEIVTLQIQNLQLEIEKTRFEIDTQANLHEIERASLDRRVADVETDIQEREEELAYHELVAPRSGVLLYTPQLKQELAKGGLPSKGLVLAEIPHEDSLAFSGELPEGIRHLFTEGDPAIIRLNQDPGRELQARLVSISPFSRDTDEEESTGVKVLDVVLELDNPPPGLPFGIYGWATLTTAKPRTGPSVPVSWIRYRESKAHVSVDGVYQPVNGIVQGDLFQFSSPFPPPERIRPEGSWPRKEEEVFEVRNDRFHASGELTPVESEGVKVPRVSAWDIKVASLYPENTLIEVGKTLVELDSEQIRERAENSLKEAQEAREEKETAEQELQLRLQEQTLQVQSAENLLRIRQLERDVELNSVSTSDWLQSRLDLTTATLNLQQARAELARLEAHPDLNAASEIERQRRTVQRRELEQERSRIRLEEVEKGIGDIARSTAELAVIRQAAETEKTKANHVRQVARAQSRLRWRTRRLRKRIEQQERAEKDLASLTIHAPATGLVKYEKVWDGVRRSKLKTGMRVWRGMQLLSLSNTGSVYVEVPVPERYVHHLHTGMEVSLRIPSEGSQVWAGTVTRLGQMLEPSERAPKADTPYTDREPTRQQVLPVRILVNPNGNTQLKPGAIAHVIFPFDA